MGANKLSKPLRARASLPKHETILIRVETFGPSDEKLVDAPLELAQGRAVLSGCAQIDALDWTHLFGNKLGRRSPLSRTFQRGSCP